MKYCVSELLTTGLSFVRTRLFFHGQRLIRFPIYIRGKKGIKFGTGLTTGYGCRIDCAEKNESLILGNNISFGDRVHIVAQKKVIIGDNCLFASNIFITDCDHGNYRLENMDILSHPNDRQLDCSPVAIGNDCWVGENVCVLKGSCIGHHCVIGANSVVNSIIPDYSVAVGQPARVKKRFNLLEMKWEINPQKEEVSCENTTL